MVATCQELGGGDSSRSGKVRELYFESGKTDFLKERLGRVKL